MVCLFLARSGSRSAAVCRVLLFLHAACRPLPGRAADFGLDMSGFVWSCLDVWISDCLDVWISMWTCLDLSGFVWICVCEHLSHVCQHLPLARDFCVNVNARTLAIANTIQLQLARSRSHMLSACPVTHTLPVFDRGGVLDVTCESWSCLSRRPGSPHPQSGGTRGPDYGSHCMRGKQS